MGTYLKKFTNISEINSGTTYPCPGIVWVDAPKSGMTRADWGFDDDEYKIQINGNDFKAIREGVGNKIYYKSTNNVILWPWDQTNQRNLSLGEGSSVFGANIVSNISGGCGGYNEITFSGNVTKIGQCAFLGPKLDYTDLIEIYLPKTITNYESQCFQQSYGLKKIKVNDEATYFGYNAFYGCTGLTELDIPTSLNGLASMVGFTPNLRRFNGIHSGITENRREFILGNKLWAFCPAGLTAYTIPSNVTTIADYTFAYADKLKNLTFHSGVTRMDYGAFANCSGLDKIVMEGSTPPSISTDVFANTNNCPIYVPFGSKSAYVAATNWSAYESRIVEIIPNNVICYTSSNGSVVTPSYSGISVFGANIVSNVYSSGRGVITFDGDVTSIGYMAFYNCTGLTSFDMPNSVTSIGQLSFYQCTGLTSFVIPNSVTTIEGNVFFFCTSLTSVTIPNSVISIGNSAFHYCSSLSTVICNPTTPPTLGTYAFSNNASGRLIYVPSSSLSAYKAATNWSSYSSYIVSQ